jgi:hypothetical protein
MTKKTLNIIFRKEEICTFARLKIFICHENAYTLFIIDSVDRDNPLKRAYGSGKIFEEIAE